MSLRSPSKTLFKGRYNEHIKLIKETKGSYGVAATRVVVVDTVGSVFVLSGSRALQYNQLGIVSPIEVMCSDPRVDFNLIEWLRNDGVTVEITISSVQDIANARLDLKILGDIRNSKNV